MLVFDLPQIEGFQYCIPTEHMQWMYKCRHVLEHIHLELNDLEFFHRVEIHPL
jgi:uncharacterized protein YprB with RNaseH-like and TPR domain